MVRTYQLRASDCLSDEEADALRRGWLDDSHYDLLIGHEDADVIKPNGSPLLVFRHNALPCPSDDLFRALRKAAVPSLNRGDAAGGREHPIKLDGTVSHTNASKLVLSGLTGYYDREARHDYCRRTVYTRDEVEGWEAVRPFIRAVNTVFKREVPDRYEAQMAAVRATHPDWVIDDTAFTTVTVNRNFRTACHMDKGDLPQGFGVMSVIQKGKYNGGYLVFPKYRVAVDMRTSDVLLADVHEYHGNTPILRAQGRYHRITTVMYFRSAMRECGTAAEEMERALTNRGGDGL